jgi:hypothetical protein
MKTNDEANTYQNREDTESWSSQVGMVGADTYVQTPDVSLAAPAAAVLDS